MRSKDLHLGLDDLWGEVLWSPTKGPRSVSDHLISKLFAIRIQRRQNRGHLGETKVGDDDVSLPVEQKVLWLEVPVGSRGTHHHYYHPL